MIKYNIVRKNLLTGEVDYGEVDSIFEAENLKGNIIKDYPFVELKKDSKEYKDFIAKQEATKPENIEGLRIINDNSKIYRAEYYGNKANTFITIDLPKAVFKEVEDVILDTLVANESAKTSGTFLLHSFTKDNIIIMLNESKENADLSDIKGCRYRVYGY